MSALRDFRHLAGKINQEYHAMAIEFRAFQAKAELSCLAGCGKCCNNPDIEASPLEMLPMALDIFDRSTAEQVLEQIENSSSCLFYYATSSDGAKGFCRSYAQRPSICRMFGAAGFSAKNGEVKLSVCKLIKENASEQYIQAQQQAHCAPRMSDWSAKIRCLHPALGEKQYPLNLALKIMLQKILLIAGYDDDGDDPKPVFPKAS